MTLGSGLIVGSLQRSSLDCWAAGRWQNCTCNRGRSTEGVNGRGSAGPPLWDSRLQRVPWKLAAANCKAIKGGRQGAMVTLLISVGSCEEGRTGRRLRRAMATARGQG
eukprot:CAMPEP_0174300594 /NCGR_PEP_ID=MMETSP0809-20121228/58552_1 /TAXON_ID=73025 ORGANISM="Eutreptiella gymnastica-like, Strain CCMP1594" /NCGR_SAMPLE_ID=MMETSP0809 /ASSEMBLY_ACC=CAM_ASM_000658 /LENGTH=107 /DNA_ID=CAMNT_0015406191 /DNA_START=1793 /DNA_END=2112 /DNA_ORIENTATION=+